MAAMIEIGMQAAGVIFAIALAIVALRWLAWRVMRLVLAIIALGPAVARATLWQRTHPLRARLADRFPRLYAALRARLAPHDFTGLPLTLLIAAACYLAALFGGLIEEVLEKSTLVRIDAAVNNAFAAYRTRSLVTIFSWITALGAGPAICAAAIIATGFLWAHRRPGFILPLWVTFLGSQATTYIGKFAIGRVRPEFLTDIVAVTPSFPSGHTTAATAVYGFLAYAIARDLPTARQRFEVSFWTAALVLVIGFSRMFLSVHFFSDVLSGLLVGGFWLIVGFTLSEWTRGGSRD